MPLDRLPSSAPWHTGLAATRSWRAIAGLLAAGGAIVSSVLLISDLGRPARFLAMLRVFKPQSPMSVGAWTLAAFGSFSGAAPLRRFWPTVSACRCAMLGNIAEGFSAAAGLPFSNYTGVLIGATAIPVWNEHVGSLPIHFGMSGLNSAVGILELIGHENPALNTLGIGAAAIETLEGVNIETSRKPAAEPLKRGTSGFITRLGGVLSGPVPLALRIAAAFAGSRRSTQVEESCGDFERRGVNADAHCLDARRTCFRARLAPAVGDRAEEETCRASLGNQPR